MRKAYAGLAVLLTVLVVAQFFFAASGAFGAAADSHSYDPHHALGYVIFSVPVLLTAVAALGRLGGRAIWLPLVIAGLVSLQVVIAEIAKGLDGTAGALVFGLHALGGLAIMGVTGVIVRTALPRRPAR
ncbi:MAG: hypothetical protein HOV83_13915 [Catenulispora sp.]|nr:hypothetical protein [Catenulispora sp.]